MNNLNITYVFGSGRREKLLNNSFTAEFFYGYQYFQNTNINLNIIEMLEENQMLLELRSLD